MSRKKAPAAVAVLLAVMVASPGMAGTDKDPEITDVCATGEITNPQTYSPEADICAGWFAGHWDPVYDDEGRLVDWRLRELTSTLQLASDLEERHRTFHYELKWSIGECRLGWFSKDYVDDADRIRSLYVVRCGEEETRYFPVPMEDIRYTGTELTVTLHVERTPDEIASLLFEGAALEASRAYTLLEVQTTAHPLEATYSWDDTPEGRTFVIGQDKPPVP